MEIQPASVTLVIPVYNDLARLRGYLPEIIDTFQEADGFFHLVVADDGSEPGQQRDLKEYINDISTAENPVDCILFEQHRGKGGTVLAAWDRSDNSDWLAFVDADGSVDAQELKRLIQRARELGTQHAVIASRGFPGETQVVQSFFRQVSSRLYAVCIRLLLGLRYKDTQCGAKIVPSQVYRKFATHLKEPGLAFDAELLWNLEWAGVHIEEMPINWMEKSGGPVNPLKDAWPMLHALWQMRKRLKYASRRESSA